MYFGRLDSNKQKQAHYSDRFWRNVQIPHESLEKYPLLGEEHEVLSRRVTILASYVELGDWVVWVEARENLQALIALKKMGYEILSEMSALDYLDSKGGFEVFYQLLSLQAKRRMRLKVFLPKGESLESVYSCFASANWSEREMYDMFGIFIENHPYLKRILMPDDWQGHPLLKSYPLQGDEAAQWYEVDKIFGREYREVVGAENRDPSRIDRYDSERFARIGHEVPKGAVLEEQGGEKVTPISYQEEGGVPLIKKIKPQKSRELKERR